MWYGLNHVDDEQKALGTFDLYKLKCIWGEILKACNVKFNDFDEIFDETPSSPILEGKKIDKSKFPNVTTVNFSNIVTSIEEFHFIENSAELKNKEETIKLLEPIANDIINAGCPDFYVVGSTASVGTKEGCLKLSQDRAEVIKNLLCNLNIPKSCLSARGIGRENIDGNFYWRKNDLDKNGKLNNNASKNRKVILIPLDSSDGKTFKKDYSNYFNN